MLDETQRPPMAHPTHASLPEVSHWSEKEGISFGWQCLVFLCVLAAIFSRRPDMFLHAQFYAEDGTCWYAQAYNFHWLHSLLIQQAGYMQTFPRLVAGLTLLFPIRFAPLLMNVAGALIQVLPVTALLSSRCRTFGTLPMRILMAGIYVAMPDASEIHVVVTNAQWHLVVLELLLAFGVAPRTWLGRACDVALFAVGSVSGPFSIIMLPFTLFYWWRRREQWTLVISALLLAGGLWELSTILHFPRPHSYLAASPTTLIRIIGGDIILAGMTAWRTLPTRVPVFFMAMGALFGGVVIAFGFLRGGLSFRLMIIFSGLFLAVALRDPLIGRDPNQGLWSSLVVDFGCRYFFYPLLVFLWSAVWCVFQDKVRIMRLAGYCVLGTLVLGVVRDWEYPPMKDHHFPAYIEQLNKAKAGTLVQIPIDPDGWEMDLVKAAPGK